MPTATLEEYLEAIYKLAQTGPVRPSQLAESMGVSPPTVTATLARLSARGLVERPDKAVVLTDEGTREALSILRRHRLAERFLVDVLGLPWGEVHEDACLLEHALSPRVQEALEAFLDSPDSCPHGHPIPTSRLEVTESEGRPLSSAPPGAAIVVTRVDESDEAILAHVAELGLYPGTSILVEEVGPFDGPIVVDVSGERLTLGREVASAITVVPVDEAGDHDA